MAPLLFCTTGMHDLYVARHVHNTCETNTRVGRLVVRRVRGSLALQGPTGDAADRVIKVVGTGLDQFYHPDMKGSHGLFHCELTDAKDAKNKVRGLGCFTRACVHKLDS